MSFPQTHWSQLAEASWHGDNQARAALDDFLRRYRIPLVQFALFKRIPEAEDAVQDFLSHVVHDSVLRRADPQRGRFRTFLIGAFKRFVAQQRKRGNALKRGGGVPHLSLDTEDGALNETLAATETSFFDHQWAMTMLDNALGELESDYRKRGRDAAFAKILNYLPGGDAADGYDAAAASLGISVGTFKSEIHRARERLRERLRSEVLKTVNSPLEVEEELNYLGQVLANHPPETDGSE